MKVDAQVVNKEATKAVLSVEVDEKSVTDQFAQVSRIFQEKSNIKGFRPGKAPLDIIKSKFKDQINHNVLENLLTPAIQESLSSAQLKLFASPRVRDIQISEGSPLKFNLEIELQPEVELCKYKDLTFHRDEYKVDQKDIDTELEKLRNHYADYITKDNNIVEESDIVTLKMETFHNGEIVKEYTTENYKTEMDKTKIMDKIFNAVIRSRVGDIKEVEVEYPQNFTDQMLAGKKIQYKITIKESKKKQLPELDDEFAKDVGEYKKIDELTQAIEHQLVDAGKARAEQNLENSIIEKVIQDSKFKIPESMIDAQYNYLYNDWQRSLQSRGYNVNDMIQKKVINPEKIQAEMRKSALKDLKVYLALKNIREKENIQVAEDEIDDEIKKYAQKYNKKFEEYKKQFNEQAIETIKQQIGNIKAINFLKENNKIKKGKKLKFEQIMKTEVSS
ncbi:MAG: trigger factor [Spirochaetes bacterium]|nr:trigger factor [Spirochaetota bacterium]